jgi:hypothetical protein
VDFVSTEMAPGQRDLEEYPTVLDGDICGAVMNIECRSDIDFWIILEV